MASAVYFNIEPDPSFNDSINKSIVNAKKDVSSPSTKKFDNFTEKWGAYSQGFIQIYKLYYNLYTSHTGSDLQKHTLAADDIKKIALKTLTNHPVEYLEFAFNNVLHYFNNFAHWSYFYTDDIHNRFSDIYIPSFYYNSQKYKYDLIADYPGNLSEEVISLAIKEYIKTKPDPLRENIIFSLNHFYSKLTNFLFRNYILLLLNLFILLDSIRRLLFSKMNAEIILIISIAFINLFSAVLTGCIVASLVRHSFTTEICYFLTIIIYMNFIAGIKKGTNIYKFFKLFIFKNNPENKLMNE